MAERESQKYWLDRPENVTKLIRVLLALCALLALIDVFYGKHVHYAFEEAIPLFYGLYGFGAYCLIVLSAKALRRLLKRDEGYYDD